MNKFGESSHLPEDKYQVKILSMDEKNVKLALIEHKLNITYVNGMAREFISLQIPKRALFEISHGTILGRKIMEDSGLGDDEYKFEVNEKIWYDVQLLQKFFSRSRKIKNIEVIGK